MISVSELATECGVSVQAIRKWCAKNEVERNAQGGYVITDDVRILAVKHYRERKDGKKVPKKDSENVSSQLSALLKQLEVKDAQLAAKDEQIVAKDAQIAAKDKQISALTDAVSSLTEQNGKLLDTNKALSAATAIHTAADKKEALLVTEPEYEAPQQPQKKPSRWQRLLAAWRG